MGWLRPIIEESKTQVFIPVQEQVVALARQIEQGKLHYTTKKPYKFEGISYPIGDATVSSETIGTVSINEECLIIDAEVTYIFFDDFTDPTDLRGIIERKIFPKIFRKGTPQGLIDRFHRGDWFDLAGTPYNITDQWKTKLSAIIKRSGQ